MSVNIYHCKNCSKELTGHQKKFCSSSCSAKFNNSRRKPRSDESRAKTSKALKEIHASGNWRQNYLRGEDHQNYKHGGSKSPGKCVICESDTLGRKTCSDTCLRLHQSKIRIAYLKSNAGKHSWIDSRGTPSYFEVSLKEWLEKFGFIHEKDFFTEYHIFNQDENTSYFLDFYFPEKNINIETDGTHHEHDTQKLRDEIRDVFLSSNGIKVMRIDIRAYNRKGNRKLILQELSDLLEPPMRFERI